MTISRKRHGELVILRLDRPPVNALDIATLRELIAELGRVESEGASAVVLTGTARVFSAGADLQRVLEADERYIAEGIAALGEAFDALFTFPRPMVAAINGHALAGGCVVACACDYRVMAEDAGTIGAVELAVGVPFPAWALEILRFAINNHHLQEVVLRGLAYDPRTAHSKGLVDELVPGDALMPRSIEVAEALALIPDSSFEITKRMLRRPAVERARQSAASTDELVKAIWKTGEVLESISKTVAALGPKR